MTAMPRADEPLSVTVVTGFLGAGKTTLVNRWLEDTRRGETAVIVNEVGDVGIDGALIADRVLELVEITGGCVCCATQADLVRALDHLASAPSRPKRILIETSGAASPAGVIHAVTGSARRGAHVLDGVITVVDATRLDVLERHDLAIEQVGYADVVALSHVDGCSADALALARSAIASFNGAAASIATARGLAVDDVDDMRSGDGVRGALERMLGARRADFPPDRDRERDAPRSHRHVYESVSLSLDGDLDEERFADFMENDLAPFAGRLLRTKGIVAVEGLPARMIIQGVADMVDVTFGDPWREAPRSSRLVLVGFGLDREALTRAFAACATRGTA